MRGLTIEDRRAEQLQGLTFLGLLVDDVTLATIHYPELGDDDERAVEQLQSFILSAEGERSASPIRRRKAHGDPAEILTQAVALVRVPEPDHDAAGEAPSLAFLREPLQRMLARNAEDGDLLTVRSFAEVLSRVTLVFSEQLINKKGSNDWTPAASSFFIGR